MIFIAIALLFLGLALGLAIGYCYGYTRGKDKQCPYCGHKPSDSVTMDDIDKELDENFKEFDDTLTKLLDTWKTVRHQADLHEKEMHRKIIDAYLD